MKRESIFVSINEVILSLGFMGFLVRCFLCVAVFGFPVSDTVGGELDQKEWQPQIDRIVKKWQEMFGPVNFRDETLFQSLLYVHPRPKQSFRDFRGEQLSREITRDHEHWRDRIFKGPFHAALMDVKPSKYYVNEGRTETSLLFSEVKFGESTVSIQESYNALFVNIAFNDYDVESGIGRDRLAHLLSAWIRLKYNSPEEVMKGFNLPEQLKLGTIFTNRDRPRVAEINAWEDYVVGFVTKHGICLILFKADGQRAQFGFPSDFDWLNRGLFKSDGVTLVDPPRK